MVAARIKNVRGGRRLSDRTNSILDSLVTAVWRKLKM